MGQTRALIIGLALVMGQTVAAKAGGDILPPPPPVVEPCIGCTGPIYLKGFVGAANPRVDGIHSELFEFNDFQVSPRHQELGLIRTWSWI